MNVTPEMIKQCEESPVGSRKHDWLGFEQEEYNCLKSRGRTLYDNLRTQFDVGHHEAWFVAFLLYGDKR